MKLLVPLAVLIVACTGHAAADRLHSRTIRSESPHQDGTAPAKVAIVNRVGYHNEVYTALLHAFVQAGADVTVFSDTNPRAALGIETVVTSWYTQPFCHFDELLPVACDYDVLAFATWPEVHVPFAELVMAKECPGQQFLLTVHNPDELEKPGNLDGLHVAAKMRAQFVALAPHTTAATAAVLKKHNLDLPVSLFVPIFALGSAPETLSQSPLQLGTVGAAAGVVPATGNDGVAQAAATVLVPATSGRSLLKHGLSALPAPMRAMLQSADPEQAAVDPSALAAGSAGSAGVAAGAAGVNAQAAATWSSAVARKGFAVQGLFQSHRRDYSHTFQEIAESPALANDPNFVLHVIGQGQVVVPANLQDRIIINTALPYKEYYATIRGCLAVLPAFASDVYYTKKASSSVAAAVVCKTPLIADAQLLKSYSYLTPESVYLKGPGETDAACMARIMQMSPQEIASRDAAMEAVTVTIYAANAKVVAAVLQQHLHAKRLALEKSHHLH